MDADENGLPADNVQFDTDEPRMAHRTSPTNIAMGLLSTLAAHDFNFIDTDDLIVRLETMFETKFSCVSITPFGSPVVPDV